MLAETIVPPLHRALNPSSPRPTECACRTALVSTTRLLHRLDVCTRCCLLVAIGSHLRTTIALGSEEEGWVFLLHLSLCSKQIV